MYAKADSSGAGIGGGGKGSGGTITVNGGMVTAQGGSLAAGIGSGLAASGGTITINVDTLSATGGYSFAANGGGAGIGGGYLGDGGVIRIPATGAKGGGNGAPAIGGGGDGYAAVFPSIVFKGTQGELTDSMEFSAVLTLGAAETLTIPKTMTLNNQGTIKGEGTILCRGAYAGTAPKDSVKMITPEVPKNTSAPTSQWVGLGSRATFAVTAESYDPVTYQWQVFREFDNAWQDIPGATGSSYTTEPTTMDMTDWQYRCVAANIMGTTESKTAILTVLPNTITGADHR